MKNHPCPVGEYTTHITFYEDPKDLFAGADLVVADENTKRYLPDLTCPVVILTPGEEHKTWVSLEKILKTALDAGLARDSKILGIGGGVLTDLTALAASLYMRGCGLILVPTTLLAMVDASFGGKTGFDFQGYKNMVGTFYPAQELRIWPGALNTLPPREYLCGLAEVIKAALLGDGELWEFLKTQAPQVLGRDPEALEFLVDRALAVKAGVVKRDFREAGERAHLNLGHTFAHALEAVVAFQDWNHGEAVAWGLSRALDLSVTLGLASPDYAQEVDELLSTYGFRLTAPGVDPQALLAAMKKDKKKKAGQVRFVVQSGPQKTSLQTVADEILLPILNRGI